jgi:spoIIIJ-associated protein
MGRQARRVSRHVVGRHVVGRHSGIEEEPGMSQQEDMVAQESGQDDEAGSFVAVSSADEAADQADTSSSLDADEPDLDDDDDADDESDGTDEDAGDAPSADAGGGDSGGGDSGGGDSGGGDSGGPAGEAERSRSVADLELEGEIAADYIEGLLDVADLDGDIDMDVEGERAVVSVVGATLDELVGRRGEVLEALQELTRLAVHQHTGSRTRMMLDVGGYRQRRRAELSEAGQTAAEEVRRTGEAKKMWPMNPFERKIVHDAVAAAGLRSESEGEEPQRRVVVLPVG